MATHRYKHSKSTRGVKKAKRKRARGGKGKYSRKKSRAQKRGGGCWGYVRCSICRRGFIGGAKAIATHKRRRHRGKGGKKRGGKKRGGKKQGGKKQGGKKRYHRFDMWAAIGREEARRQKLLREATRQAANTERLKALGASRRRLRALGRVDWDMIAKAEIARRAAGSPSLPLTDVREASPKENP